MFPKVSTAMRIESGTCTVCSAPCSLCMHQKSESGVSCNLSVRIEADNSYVINVAEMPIYKNRICDDFQPAASEASNLLSTTSSHDSYSENAESKASLRASAGYDASDDVNMSQAFSVESRRCAEIDNVDSSLVMEGALNLQPQEEIRKCTEIDDDDCSVASLSGGNSSVNKSSSIPNHEVSTSRTQSGFSSDISNINGLCQDTRSGTDSKILFEKCHLNDLERDDAVLDAKKGQDQFMPPQVATVGENYESDVALDDVKVCDICGDAGREDHLAICSKCSDGAEHTYCMREMLDKVPEGEWLCEECKIQETESQNVNECEAIYGRLKSTCLNDNMQNSMSTLISKQTHKLDARPTDLGTRGSTKELQSPHMSIRRLADPLEEAKASELSGASIEIASPREKPVLSRQISSKNQGMGKVKAARMEPSSEDQLAKISEAPRSKTFTSSSSFKGLPPLYSPRGKISRAVSFNNSIVNPKVKTLLENAPPKQKITSEPTTNESRKVDSFKTSTKTIFKDKNSECSKTELASKNPLLDYIEDLRALKEVKDRNTVEKKNLSAKRNSFVRPSEAITSSYPLKVGAKTLKSDGIKNCLSEKSVCSSSEGLDGDNSGSNEGKKPISYSSKHIKSSSGNYDDDNHKGFKVTNKTIRSTSVVDGSYRKFEIESPRSAVQPLESGHEDTRTKDSTFFTGSKISALGGTRTFHSQRGHETGRTTQDKHVGSSHRISPEENSREVEKKGNKWREVVNAAMSRSGVLKGEKSDTLEEFPAVSAHRSCEAASKHASGAFNQRFLAVENHIGKISSKDSAAIGSAQLDLLPVEGSDKANGTRDTINATEFSAMSSTEMLRDAAPLLANPSSGSAVPKLECIWQGSFYVIGTGSHTKMFFGIQAHLSTCASHRVFKLAAKVPGNVRLQEVSHISSWPLQLLRSGPQDENIALFFFAKDIESYDNSYRKLLDKMHRNDLALRGNIEGTELLIFTSNKLPMNSQRWNRMHYLWGMFRGKRRYHLPVMGDQKKSLLSNEDFSLAPIADVVSNAQSLETSSKLKKLSDFMSSKVVPWECTNDVDLPLISSKEQHLLPVRCSSEAEAEPLGVTIDTPNSRLQMTATKSCSEVKNNGTCEEKLVGNCTYKKAGNCITYVPSVSPNCNKGSDCINIGGNNGEKETSPSVVAVIDDDDQRGNAAESDLLGCESMACRKRERPHSIGMPKSTVDTVLSSDRSSWLPVEDGRGRKKTCYNSVSSSSNIDENGSARSPSKAQKPVQIWERGFFEVDFGPVQNTKCANLIDISSSKEEDAIESSSPDLELALGGKGKSTKPFRIPSLFHSVDGGKQPLQPGSSDDGDDDASASLSLSL